MVLNKKGIVFTLVTITLLSIFAISYGAYSLIKDRAPINKRINTLNSFVASVETDLPRQLFVSGYRAIFLINKEILDTGEYISDVNASINEIFFHGTLDGEQQDLMDDATFTAIENFLNSNANKISADLRLLNPKIELTQADPWNLKLTLNTTLIITDRSGLASWNRTASIHSYIPISNLVDPLYAKNTGIANNVIKTPYTTFVSGGDDTNLTDHFQNSYYKASVSAPSYLNRLEGDLSADPNGIESIVYPQDLTDKGINVQTKSLIDYIYFSNNNPTPIYRITPVSVNLILDQNHLDDYNATDIANLIT